jgi:hypothetical protein
MSKMTSRAKHHLTPTPEALLQDAIASRDGHIIADLVKQIEAVDAPREFIENALREVVKAHPEMSPVVIGCLSSLERMRSTELRPLCRLIVNAPFEPDRDLIVAYAATLLARHQDPEQVDILLLAKAVDHRSEHVKLSTRRALRDLSRAVATQIISRASELPEKPQISMLKRFANGEATLSTLTLPPIPKSSADQAGPRNAQDRRDSIPRLKEPKEPEKVIPFSTPTADALIEKNKPSLPKTSGTNKEGPSTKGDSETKTTPEPALSDLLNPHRIEGYHLLSDSALAHTIILSKDYRAVAGAMAEYTLRRGVCKAREYNGRLVYALSDDTNTEKGRFSDIATAWFQIT